MKKKYLLLIIAVFVVVAGVIYFTSDSSDTTPSPEPESIEEVNIPKNPPGELNVLSYNVFLRPAVISTSDYTTERAELIGEWLEDSNMNVVTLQEAWNTRAVSILLEMADNRFPYCIADEPGGLLILSRWPITEKRTLTYENCHEEDCFVAKGALHVVIQVSESEYVNVVTTHLESGGSAEDFEARESQIEQLSQFVFEIDEDSGPIIITGDFNIDYLGSPEEHDMLVETLGVEDYIVEDISTKNCDTEDGVFCDVPIGDHRLDYIFTKSGEKRITRKETFHLSLTTSEIDGGVKYLSDHRAVRSVFETNFN